MNWFTFGKKLFINVFILTLFESHFTFTIIRLNLAINSQKLLPRCLKFSNFRKIVFWLMLFHVLIMMFVNFFIVKNLKKLFGFTYKKNLFQKPWVQDSCDNKRFCFSYFFLILKIMLARKIQIIFRFSSKIAGSIIII